MQTPTPTRERLINEATRLFSAQGYETTSVSQIEAAAGLAAGSGALYNHFRSKELLLDACINRQLDRRHAMNSIRAIFAGLENFRDELTALGRYLSSILDQEVEFLRIVARTPPERSTLLDTAYTALIEGLNAELTDWIATWAPTIDRQQCATIATVGLNGLLGARLAPSLFRENTPHTDDHLTEWTAILATRIQAIANR